MLVGQMAWANRFLIAWLALHQENLELNLWFSYAEPYLEIVLSVIFSQNTGIWLFVRGCLFSLKKPEIMLP